MSWLGWAVLALAAGLVALPAPSVVRASGLARTGRLVPRAGRPAVARTPAWSGRRRAWVAVAAVGGAVLLVGGVGLAIAAAAVAALAGVLIGDAHRSRATSARRRDVLTAVRVLVGELESGTRPAVALAAAAETAPAVAREFAAAAETAAAGRDAGGVLLATDDDELRAVGLAWRIGEAAGAASGGVLHRVADDLGAGEERNRAVRVALAGPRSSAVLLAGLPVLGIGLGTAMGARPLPFLLTDHAGRLLCCAGVLLDVAGLLWMRAILSRAARE